MNKANIKLNNTAEQVELIKAMVSPDAVTAAKARSAFAKFIGPMLQQVLNLQSTVNQLYVDWPYNEDDLPMFPLDQYYQQPVGSIKVWQQNAPGGLGSSVESGLQELPITTYRLDTAVGWLEKTIRRGRLPYVSLGLNRAAQELLRLQERNGWLVVLKALAEARTKAGPASTNYEHIIQSTASDVLQLDDFNRWLTRAKRINVAFDNQGTPEQVYSRGATDAFLSPEMMEQIRSFVYQPMNTRSGKVDSNGATSIPLPDSIRENVYRNAGLSEVYGIVLHEMLEFGISQRYNTIFDGYYNGALSFDTVSQEIIVGVDRSRDAIIRPIAQNADYGTSLVMQEDDQWPKRAGKLGFFGAIEEGRAVIDARVLSGLIIQ